MAIKPQTVPFPELKIIHKDHILPHEEHDSQRSKPLIKRIQEAEFLTNPPLVAPINEQDYVILDGSNRYHSLCAIGYDHILAQVVDYDSEHVELGVWQHIISHWDPELLMQSIREIPDIDIQPGWNHQALAQILMQDGLVFYVQVNSDDVKERNRLLRQIVAVYQRNATLYRTVITDPVKIWELYPRAIAIILFPPYYPEHIIEAAVHNAFLPPGISRHLVHGRALMINYPLDKLFDQSKTIDEKNNELVSWMQEKLATRSVRYYAESTYHFSE